MRAAAEFLHIHASGRFDATLREVFDDWERFRRTPGCKLITGTEHGSGDHDSAFDAEGWDYYRGHECVVSWREDTFEFLDEGVNRIKGATFRRGSNKHAYVWLTWVLLRHRTTRRLVMVRVCHMPASVQDGGKFRVREVRKVAAWVNALRYWGKVARAATRDEPDTAQINVADWNVDLFRKVWRAMIRKALGQRCAWSVQEARRGSLGRRLIDGLFFRLLRVLRAWVMDKGESSDHHPIATKFQITSVTNKKEE